MADVTGDIGGQPVQLNNAATETTLKEIALYMRSLAAAQGKGSKNQKDLEKELKKLADSTKKAREEKEKETAASKKLREEKEKEAKAAEDAKEAREKEAKQIAELANGLGALFGAVEKTALGMTNLMKDLANVGNSMTSAAQSLSAIPIAGNLLSGVFGAVAGAADRTYKSFQQAASVGANFGGSIQDMINSATGAGLTFDQFSSIINKSGEALALLGGNTSNGAKRLAELGRGIRDSDLGNQLAALGYNTESINEGLATYSGMLAKTGALQGMNNSQLIESTGTYLKNLDAVSKLTGQSKKELEDARQQRMKDAQFRMIMSKMDATSQENLQMLMDTIPEEHREGMKEIIATGTATSEAGKAALAFLPDTARQMMATNQQIRTTGKLSAEQARNMGVSYQREASAFAKSPLSDTLAGFGDDMQKKMALGAMNVAARTGDINKSFEQQQKEAEERKKKEEQLKKEGLDPESMKTYQEKISEVSNQFTKLLGSSTLLSDMMKMFQSLVDFTSTFVVPAFQFVGENSKIFGVALGGLAVVVGTVNGILAVNNFLEKMRQIANMGAVAGLGKLAVASLAAALPFIKFAAPVLLLIYAFNKLGGDLSVVSNAFKYVGSILTTVFKTAFKAILSIINKIPGFRGDFDNQIKELNDDLASEETKRSNITKEVTATMKKNREETEKSTEAKKEENKQIEQATSTTAQYDFSSPLKLFESSARRAGSAASTAATPPGGAAATRSLSGNMSSSLASAGITDPRAIANIMAQIQAESGGVAKSENLNYSGKKLFELYGAGNKGGNKVRFNTQAEAEAVASKGPEAVGNVIYGGRMGNAADEGFKYRGRGLIQLTGKNNYKKYGDMIGVDLVSNPDLANDPKVAEQLAVAYFAEKQKQGVNLSDINAIGKAVGYAGGSAETSKRAAMAEQFLAGGGASTPSSASVVASVQQPTPAAPAATTPSSTGAGAPGAGGIATLNDVVAGLNSLNMMMGQVVATNKRVVEVAEKQLSVQKNLSGDLYLAA